MHNFSWLGPRLCRLCVCVGVQHTQEVHEERELKGTFILVHKLCSPCIFFSLMRLVSLYKAHRYFDVSKMKNLIKAVVFQEGPGASKGQAWILGDPGCLGLPTGIRSGQGAEAASRP